MKKIYIFLSIFVITFAACSDNKNQKNDKPSTNESIKFKDKQTDEYLFASNKHLEPNLHKDSIDKIAKEISKKYDQFIFYCLIDKKPYYCVTKGKEKFDIWTMNFNSEKKFKVGLLDEYLKEIIPVEYDKIYNPNDIIDGGIIVEKNNKRGIYDFSGNLIVEVSYDAIYPSFHQEVLVQVKKDNKFGWIDMQKKEHFDDNSTYSNSPIASDLILKWKTFRNNIIFWRVCQLINDWEDYDNAGMLFTPAYIYELGMMPEYFPSVVMDKSKEYYMGSDSVFAQVVEKKTFGEKVIGFVTDFIETGVEGRGYQMKQQELILVNQELDTISTLVIGYGDANWGDYCFEPFYNFYGDTMIEIVKENHWEYELHSLPKYEYYRIEKNGQIEHLNTNRYFAYTKFVKITEDYFKGCFYYYLEMENDEDFENNIEVYEHLTLEDLDIMRNEIFAEYGMKFNTDKWKVYFEKFDWYQPKYDNVEDKLTEIDKHNLDIILKTSEKLKKDENKYLKKRKDTFYQAG